MKKKVIIFSLILFVLIGLFFISCDLVQPTDPDHNGVDITCPLPWCHHNGAYFLGLKCVNNLIKTTPIPIDPSD